MMRKIKIRDDLLKFSCGSAFVTLVMLLISEMGMGHPLLGYLTYGRGVLDDWLNLFHLANSIPDPNALHIYPPISIVFVRAIKYLFLISDGVWLFFFIVACCLLSLKIASKDSKIILLLLTSYPVLFGISRGNLEVIAFFLAFLGAICLLNGKTKSFVASTAAGALIKPFPILFLVGGTHRKWKLITIAVVVYCIINIFFLYLLSNSGLDAYERFSSALGIYKRAMIFEGSGDLFNNSIFSYAWLISETRDNKILYLFQGIAIAFMFCCVLLAFMILGVRQGRSSEVFYQLVCLTFIPVAVILCVPVSADYRLCYLLITVYYLSRPGSAFANNVGARRFLTFLCFLILTPKHFILYISPGFPPITIQSYINPLLLITLCISALFFLYKDQRDANHSAVYPSH